MTADAARPPLWRRGAGRFRTSPYWPAVSHPALRRLMPGYGLSSLGDGMSVVAIAWLALRIAPPGRGGLWVSAAIIAYTLPAAAGSVLFGRWLRDLRGVRLAGADATLRAAALGAIPVLYALHVLGPLSYVGLLGLSSLLHAWGSAGQFTIIAEVLPQEHRVAGNALLSTTASVTIVAGPALAGLLTALAGPATVIAVDAGTFAVLALSYAWAAPLIPAAPASPEDNGDSPRPAARSGWSVVRASPTLLGLTLLTFAFYLLYGPVEVALPVHVQTGLHGSAAVLGLFWTSYAVGAAVGSLLTVYLRRWPVGPTVTAIVAGWGLGLIPLGTGAPLGVALACFAAGGVIYAPYTSLSMAVFQETCPPGTLAPVLASRAVLIIASAPIGTAVGGPLVVAIGAQHTLLVSSLATLALAAASAVALTIARLRRGNGPSSYGPSRPSTTCRSQSS